MKEFSFHLLGLPLFTGDLCLPLPRGDRFCGLDESQRRPLHWLPRLICGGFRHLAPCDCFRSRDEEIGLERRHKNRQILGSRRASDPSAFLDGIEIAVLLGGGPEGLTRLQDFFIQPRPPGAWYIGRAALARFAPPSSFDRHQIWSHMPRTEAR